MKRKINRVGTSTLTVSLPSKWAKQHGLKQGDEVDVAEEDTSISITVGKTKKTTKKVALRTEGFSTHLMNRVLGELYISGADEIIINLDSETIPDYKNGRDVRVNDYVKKIIHRFIGIEIVYQTPSRIILQSMLAGEKSENNDVAQRRAFYLMKEFFDEFLACLDEDFETFHGKSYDYHDTVGKFVYYYLRLLLTSDMDCLKKSKLLSLYNRISGILDKVRHTSEHIAEMKKISGKLKNYLKEIFDFFIEEFKLVLSKPGAKEIDALIKRRYALVKKIRYEKFTDDEYRVISECKPMLDTINDFAETYFQLNLEEFTVD